MTNQRATQRSTAPDATDNNRTGTVRQSATMKATGLTGRTGPAAVPGLMIVVHPGSACGSADFNLGRQEATAARSMLARDLAGWRGHVLVVDGLLSDELPRQPALAETLDGCLARAATAGLRTRRMLACDASSNDWTADLRSALAAWRLPRTTRVAVTGAWWCRDGSAGCVNAAYDVATAMGHRQVDIRDSALEDPGG